MTDRFARIPERAIGCKELWASDWRVLACIALHSREGQAYPGVTTIAEMTGVRRQDVPRHIRRLEQFQQLRCEPGAGPRGANLYILNFDPAEASASVRTVRTGADPHIRVKGVRTYASKGSAHTRTKQTIEQTNEQKGAGDDGADQWFERFWTAYPDRGDKTNPRKPALDKFKAALKRGADPAAIIRGAENYRRVMERHRGDDRQYVKQAVGWLTSELWEQYQASANPARPKFGGMV